MAQQQNTVNPNWDGSPLTLNQYDSVTMPQTPIVSMIFAWENEATTRNEGTLALTANGGQPQFLDAPPGVSQPGIKLVNWQASQLTVTNVSTAPDTPILIELIGPGLSSVMPVPLPTGTPVTIAPGGAAQGQSQAGYMQLVMQAIPGRFTTVVMLGGPLDAGGNNGYLFALNYPSSSFPPGYTECTTGNTLTYQFNWGTGTVYVANMSAPDASLQVTLVQL